jgi:predicted Rossmann fold nucleotide-binding protein DprA/Smf involved in DNA uptake
MTNSFECKDFHGLKRKILISLENEAKTIPQIAEETGIPVQKTTHILMTARRYGEITETEEISDDECFYYKIKVKETGNE